MKTTAFWSQRQISINENVLNGDTYLGSEVKDYVFDARWESAFQILNTFTEIFLNFALFS